MLNESNIRKAYHWTHFKYFIEMVAENRLDMSSGYGVDEEEVFSLGKYPFYLSTTQYSNPKEGFQSDMDLDMLVRLELNISYMTNKGVFRRVNYHAKHKKGTGQGTKYESEDRFLTTHPSLPFDKAVVAVKSYSVRPIPANIANAMDGMGVAFEAKGRDGYDFGGIAQYPNSWNGVVQLALIKRIWGDDEMARAIDRLGDMKGEEAELAELVGYYDVDAVITNPKYGKQSEGFTLSPRSSKVKAIMRPYYVRAMKEGIPFSKFKESFMGGKDPFKKNI